MSLFTKGKVRTHRENGPETQSPLSSFRTGQQRVPAGRPFPRHVLCYDYSRHRLLEWEGLCLRPSPTSYTNLLPTIPTRNLVFPVLRPPPRPGVPTRSTHLLPSRI